jgi:2-hydroxychromene-2-carboxylate isomerase
VGALARLPPATPTFYFDLGSPFAYLTAERLHDVLPEPVSWQPISLGALFKMNGRSSWGLAPDSNSRPSGMAEVERRALAYGLPPVRWPDPWPTHYLFAMRLATYALQVGRGRELALQAFRHAFQQGFDLSVPEQVLDAASEAGLNRVAAEEATRDPQIKLALRAATDAAHELGVVGVPTIAIAGELFWGDDRLGYAARCCASARHR